MILYAGGGDGGGGGGGGGVHCGGGKHECGMTDNGV